MRKPAFLKPISRRVMNYGLITAFTFLIVVQASAQSYPGGTRPGSSYEKKDVKKGNPSAIIGISGTIPQINDTKAFELGINLGVGIENFRIGAAYYGLISKNIDLTIPDKDYKAHLRLDYGGLSGEYVYYFFDFLGASVKLPFYLAYANYSMSSQIGITGDLSGDYFFIVEPTFFLNIKPIRSMEFGMGAGYRHSAGLDFQGLNSSDMSGVNFQFRIQYLFY